MYCASLRWYKRVSGVFQKAPASKPNPVCTVPAEPGWRDAGWKSQQTNKNTAFCLWRCYIKFKPQSESFFTLIHPVFKSMRENPPHPPQKKSILAIMHNPSVLGWSYRGANGPDFYKCRNNLDQRVIDSLGKCFWETLPALLHFGVFPKRQVVKKKKKKKDAKTQKGAEAKRKRDNI